MFVKLIYSILLISLVSSEYVDYENHKVYKVTPQTEKDVKFLLDVEKNNDFLFWTQYYTVGKEVKIQVAPEKQNKFEKLLSEGGLKTSRIVENVKKLIDDQLRRPVSARSGNILDYAWDYYQDLDEIYEWMNATVAAHPDVATLVSIGTTYEERPIWGIVIDFKKEPNATIGFMEGGLHAREWITPAILTWTIKEFLTSNDPGIRAMAEDIVWHIFPVTNPDGYVYSFTDNRMWRKNRNPLNATSCAHLGISDDFSVGVDLNRNFGFLWGKFDPNPEPCTIVFPGPTAFSEVESIAIANYINTLKTQGTVLYYLAYHSFSQMMLLPHSHLNDENVLQVAHYADLFEIAEKGMDKLKQRHNETYTVGTATHLLNAMITGTGMDWAKGTAEIPLSFLWEARDRGAYGFLLPPHEIIPNSEETVDGIVGMHEHAIRLGYFTRSGANMFTNCITVSIVLLFTVMFVN